MPVKELPILITPTIASDPDRMAKAVMRNFDHLIGEAGFTQRIVEAGPDESVIEAIIHETEDGSVSLIEKLNEQGVGPSDGSPPTGTITDFRIIGGVGNMLIMDWSLIDNNSPVEYEVHISTSAGFVPASTTLAGVWRNPGGSAPRGGSWVVRTFPSTHHLAGQSVQPNTTYWGKVVVMDEDGVGTTSNEASGTSILITETHIGPNSITSPLIAANQIVAGHIASGEITTGHISAVGIHGDKIQANTVVAKEIYGKYLFAYTMEASSIIGSYIRTAGTSSTRVELNNSSYGAGTIVFYLGSTLVGKIVAGNGMYMEASNGAFNLASLTGTGAVLSLTGGDLLAGYGGFTGNVDAAQVIASGLLRGNKCQVGDHSAIPPSGFASIYKDTGNTLSVRFPDGTIKSVNLT